MKSTDELLIVPHEEGFRAWRAKGGHMQAVDGETKGWRNAEWVALPAKAVVSVPMRFQGVEGARRDSAAHLELEAAGFSVETADNHNFEILNCGSGDEKDAPIAALIQIAPLPQQVLEAADHARFVPSVACHQLQPGEALMWHEAGSLVIAIPNAHGSPLHCQAIAARHLDADAATEVRRILGGLELAGVLPELQTLCISTQSEDEEDIPEDFAHGLDLPVTTRRAGPPVMPDKATRLVPAPVVQLRQERQQQRMVFMGVAAFTFVLIAALGAFAMRVMLRERQLVAEEQRLNEIEPQLTSIRDAKANWEDLRPAVTPDHFPVESIYQFILLMPPEGIRVTRMELRTDGMVVDGEATSLGHGIEFRDRLMAAPAFQRWQWDFPAPTSLPDGRATFRAEARPHAILDANGQEVTSL